MNVQIAKRRKVFRHGEQTHTRHRAGRKRHAAGKLLRQCDGSAAGNTRAMIARGQEIPKPGTGFTVDADTFQLHKH